MTSKLRVNALELPELKWFPCGRHTMTIEPPSPVLLDQTSDGQTRLEVRLENETVWLSLNQLAGLFQRDNSVISRHIKNVFAAGELKPEATVAKFATVQAEGSKRVARDIEVYNLDVILTHAGTVS